jgi:xylan 1,4-beta-xylosidase
MPEFFCDTAQRGSSFNHFWEHTVGSGHAPLALRADWQAQLKKCHAELGFKHVRFHGPLSGNMGTLIIHQDELLYSFFNLDQIYDYLLSIGVRPFVELSFMPTALASGGETVFNYANNVTPPRNYEQWGSFIGKLVRHLVARYGLDEVRNWYFEVWNEPNLKAFWTGTQADYFKLYRYTAAAIKAVDASLRVGGPSSAKNEWIEEFITFCAQNDLPADFITTHHYPTDAFGSPDDPTIEQLAQSERSVLRAQAREARRQSGDKPLFYTEWNSSSNPRDPMHDEAYCAAFATKTIMEAQGLVQGYSFWTFTDIFEENYFPSQPFHGGFGLLNLHGIPKPVYRAYELLHQLGNEQLAVEGAHKTVDVWAVKDGDKLDIILTNHALPKHDLATEKVTLHLQHLAAPNRIQMACINEDHVNPRRAWQEMGEPAYLSPGQVAQLEEASQLNWESVAAETDDAGDLHLALSLPPQSVTAVTIES